MSAHNISVAFHGADAKHHIIPFELDEAYTLKTPTHLKDWKDRVAEIYRICKAKGFNIARVYENDPAKKWLHILLIDTEHLKSHKFFDQIAGSTLRPMVDPESRGKNLDDKNKGRYDPVITISTKDFLDLNTRTLLEELADKRKRDLHDQNLDTRVKFLDSSIWHRYVPEMPGTNTEAHQSKTPSFQVFLEEVLDEITSHWQEGLYYTISAVTTLEFQLRMLRHSFIGQFGDGGHAGVVTPFKFHSERHLQLRSELREKDNFFTKEPDNRQSLLRAFQWRMLLVDDYANKYLSTVGKPYKCRVKKSRLVRRPLDKLYIEHGIDPKKQFKLVSPTVKKGIIKFSTDELSKHSFDVIFLDYLLGDRPDYGSGNPKNREYGHELLLHLIEDSRESKEIYHRDFFGRYWIFPVSSFPFALSDKLAQLGVGHLHSIWHLSGGGDPVTTPHFYTFYLLRFLKQKVAEYYLYPKALQRLLNEIPNFPNTKQGAGRWAKCICTALEHYKSRLNVVEDSKADNTQSPFLKSMADFLTKQVKIDDLLDKITNVANSIAESGLDIDLRVESVHQLENTIKENFPEYQINLEGFLEKARHQNSRSTDRARREITEAKSNGSPSLDLSGLSLSMVPEELVFELPHLNDLSLHDNKVKNIPRSLAQLSDLKKLNLSRNDIQSLSTLPHLLETLHDLEYLDLTDNPICAKLPQEFHRSKGDLQIGELRIWLSQNGSRLDL